MESDGSLGFRVAASDTKNQLEGCNMNEQKNKALKDYVDQVEGRDVKIIYHGGCPDGVLSALMVDAAMIWQAARPKSVKLFPTDHSLRMADVLTPGCVAFFVDTSPRIIDAACLLECFVVIVMDHHKSSAEAMDYLRRVVPQLDDYSDYGGSECGVSLAKQFTMDTSVPDDLLHLFWNMDVFKHELPAECKAKRDAFFGFITQQGLHKCDVKLVRRLLMDPKGALDEGLAIFPRVAESTRLYFKMRKLMYSDDKLSVYVADVGDLDAAVDLQMYQRLIDSLQATKAVIFVTLVRVLSDSGTWSMSIRRTGEDLLPVDVVCQRLRHQPWCKGGGGHPYAAGAQCEVRDLPANVICDAIVVICGNILCEMEQLRVKSPKAKRQPRDCILSTLCALGISFLLCGSTHDSSSQQLDGRSIEPEVKCLR